MSEADRTTTDGLFAIAHALRDLGKGDAASPMGAMEFTALELKNGLSGLASSIEEGLTGLSTSVDLLTDAIDRANGWRKKEAADE